MRIDDPEQPLPEVTTRKNISFSMPAPNGSCWINAYVSEARADIGGPAGVRSSIHIEIASLEKGSTSRTESALGNSCSRSRIFFAATQSSEFRRFTGVAAKASPSLRRMGVECCRLKLEPKAKMDAFDGDCQVGCQQQN